MRPEYLTNDNSYLQFKCQLPTSDSTQITAGGPKVPTEGFVPLDAPSDGQELTKKLVTNSLTNLF